MDTNLGKLQEILRNRVACYAAVREVATEQQQIRKDKTNRSHFLLMVLCLIGKMTLSQSQYKK